MEIFIFCIGLLFLDRKRINLVFVGLIEFVDTKPIRNFIQFHLDNCIKSFKTSMTINEVFVSTNNKLIASSLSVFVAWVARDTYYGGMRLWISS